MPTPPDPSTPPGYGTVPAQKRARARARLSAEVRARIVELATSLRDDGTRWTVRQVAEAVGVSRTTVSRVAREDAPPGFTWEGTLAPATAARRADGEARRARLAERYLDAIEAMLDKLDAAHEVTHWDRDGIMRRATIDRPTSGDVRNYAIAAGVLTDKHLAILRADGGDADESAVEAFHISIMGTKPPRMPW